MNIAGMRVKVTIQKNVLVVDEYGNHTNDWVDYFKCWATAVSSGVNASEEEKAAVLWEGDRLDITVRFCSETALIDSTHYRIIVNDRIYNIESVSDMGFGHKCRLFHTRLEVS